SEQRWCERAHWQTLSFLGPQAKGSAERRSIGAHDAAGAAAGGPEPPLRVLDPATLRSDDGRPPEQPPSASPRSARPRPVPVEWRTLGQGTRAATLGPLRGAALRLR